MFFRHIDGELQAHRPELDQQIFWRLQQSRIIYFI